MSLGIDLKNLRKTDEEIDQGMTDTCMFLLCLVGILIVFVVGVQLGLHQGRKEGIEQEQQAQQQREVEQVKIYYKTDNPKSEGGAQNGAKN